MDLGIFLRSRASMAGWIAVPLVLIMLVYQGTRLYCQAVEDELAQDRAMMEIMPDLLSGLHRARETLAQFAVGSLDDVGVFLTESSDYHGFQLESVQVTEQPGKPGKQAPSLIVRVEGKGTLLSMIQFLEILQQPKYLVSVESANVQLLTQSAENRFYRGRFVLHYAHLSLSAPAPP